MSHIAGQQTLNNSRGDWLRRSVKSGTEGTLTHCNSRPNSQPRSEHHANGLPVLTPATLNGTVSMKSEKYSPLSRDLTSYEVESRRLLGTAAVVSMEQIWSSEGGVYTHGFWEMTPGVLDDVRGAESVVILAGRATVDFLNSGARIELAAGDVCVISGDEPTRWTVHERLRKFYARRA
jgi:uncharacterized cupin superfamily protein